MANNDIQWFNELIKNDRKNNLSSKRKAEIKELLYNFVENCPAKDGPTDAKKFDDYGFKHGSDYGKYKQRIFKNISLLSTNYVFVESPKTFADYKGKIISLYNGRKTPTIIFAKGNYGEIDTLFIKLRNAFAHKNYFKKGDYYILWNDGQNHDKLSCFMVLKYNHLISIFNELIERD